MLRPADRVYASGFRTTGRGGMSEVFWLLAGTVLGVLISSESKPTPNTRCLHCNAHVYTDSVLQRRLHDNVLPARAHQSPRTTAPSPVRPLISNSTHPDSPMYYAPVHRTYVATSQTTVIARPPAYISSSSSRVADNQHATSSILSLWQSHSAQHNGPVNVQVLPIRTATPGTTDTALSSLPRSSSNMRVATNKQAIGQLFARYPNELTPSVPSVHAAIPQTAVTTPLPPTPGDRSAEDSQIQTRSIDSPSLPLPKACEQCFHSPPPAIREGESYARWLRNQADQFNEKASKEFFKFHNPQIAQKFRFVGKIDLHNQKVKEAMTLAGEYVEQARRSRLKKLMIVVGKGNHAADGEPVLRPRILQALEEWGIEASLDKINKSVIVAQIHLP